MELPADLREYTQSIGFGLDIKHRNNWERSRFVLPPSFVTQYPLMAKLLSLAELWEVDAFIVSEDDFADGDPEFDSIEAKQIIVAFWRASSAIYSWQLLRPKDSRQAESASSFWTSISEVRVSTGSAVVGGIEGLGPCTSVDEEDYEELAAEYSDDFDEDDGEPFVFSVCKHVAFGQSGDVFVEDGAGRLTLISPGNQGGFGKPLVSLRRLMIDIAD